MIIPVLLLLLGLALLIKGADWFVDGASSLAHKYKVSNLTIGLTIVAFGTSAPELVVNSFASFQGQQEIVFANVIGSNIFNLLLILGIAGLITPLKVQSSSVWKEIPFSLLAVLILFLLVNETFTSGPNFLSRIDGFILMGFFLLFLYYVYRNLKNEQEVSEGEIKELSPLKMGVFITLGLLALIIGGNMAVDQAVILANNLGISQKVIGLTIIAAGTSLPELATSVVAALKKHNDIAVGNIIGSNIFNIFFILSVSSIISPLDYDPRFNLDLFVIAGGTIFLFIAMFTGEKKKLDRWEAAILLVGFFIYMGHLLYTEL